jgi:hypothetical protein
MSPEYPGDHRLATCASCHTTNRDAATWNFPQYRPYCAGCHAGDYRASVDRHRGLANDLNCGNSGCHRVNASSF